MLSALPRDTVFEARRRARRATVVLFVILLVIYAVFFNLLLVVGGVAAVLLAASPVALELAAAGFWRLNLLGLAAGAVVAFVQFAVARRKRLEDILPLVGAKPIDTADRVHARFGNLVEEAEVATGLGPVRPMVIPSTGLNACSLRTRDGMAICVTEGLVSRLTRQELAAVVAHEAGRLVSDDSRLTTTAAAIVNVFGSIGKAIEKNIEAPGTGFRRERAQAHAFQVLIWFVAAAAHGVLSLVFMALSRDRGFHADAQAVEMCKDPLALAEAISKMSSGYRGCGEIRPGYEAIFVVDPRLGGLSEGEGLVATIFMTHPPLKKRLRKLLEWAKADVSALRPESRLPPPFDKLRTAALSLSKVPPEPVRRGPEVLPEAEAAQTFYVSHDGRWRGPYLPMQMLALGILGPRTWVAADLARGPIRASDHPALLPLFCERLRHTAGSAARLSSPKSDFSELPGIGRARSREARPLIHKRDTASAVSGRRCPRCKVPLVEREYEGAPVLNCVFCDGYLLKPDVIGRIIARREKRFTSKEIKEARRWRSRKSGRAEDICGFPDIKCPVCGGGMEKRFHSVLVRVVLDFCTDRDCGAVWADGGELENVQVIVEDASVEKT